MPIIEMHTLPKLTQMLATARSKGLFSALGPKLGMFRVFLCAYMLFSLLKIGVPGASWLRGSWTLETES